MRPGRPPHPDLLTPREQEVLSLLREGLTNAEIGERLGISADGAKYHVAEILSKLGVSTRQEAAQWGGETSNRTKRFGGIGGGLIEPLRRASESFLIKAAASGLIVAAGIGLVLLAFGVFSMDARRQQTIEGSPSRNTALVPGQFGSLGKLVYIDDGDVWTKALPNGAPQRLTTDGNNTAPRWSPSGDWISFEKPAPRAPSSVWIMRADGSQKRQVDTTSRAYRWSPTDDRIAFIDPKGALAIENADGSGRVAVVAARDGESATWWPRWSPDGEWLTYTLAVEEPGTPAAGECCGLARVGLWAVRADGSEPHELLGIDKPRFGLIVAGWMPDSQWVIFSPDPSFSTSYVSDGLQWQIAPLDPTAGPVRGVFQSAIDGEIAPEQEVLRYDDFVDFSTDGKIAVVRGGRRDANTNKVIAVVTGNGGPQSVVLTSPEVAATSPDWSPDGSELAYVQQPAGGDYDPGAVNQKRIWLMDSDGSNKHPLPIGDAWAERPQWSIDGRSILYVRPEDGNYANPTPAAIASDSGHFSLVLYNLASAKQETVLDNVDFYVNDLGRGIGYFGHMDWDLIFDWWQP